MLLLQVGFSGDDIKSLSNIGRSTKVLQEGSIGQKGLGFKSVFKVTDAPQVHSGGFHISYDLGLHKKRGYFLPTWLEPDAWKGVSSGRALDRRTAATQLVLPLKKVTLLSYSLLQSHTGLAYM